MADMRARSPVAQSAASSTYSAFGAPPIPAAGHTFIDRGPADPVPRLRWIVSRISWRTCAHRSVVGSQRQITAATAADGTWPMGLDSRQWADGSVCRTATAASRSWSTCATDTAPLARSVTAPLSQEQGSQAQPDSPVTAPVTGGFFRSSDSRPYAGERASRLRRVLARTRRRGNAGMAGDDSRAQVQLDQDTLARRRRDTLAAASGLAISLWSAAPRRAYALA
jgi:hypothetical protein